MRSRIKPRLTCAQLALAYLLMFGLGACQRTRTPVSPSPVANESFLDLQAGWRLRIVAPVLENPAQPNTLTVAGDGPQAFSVTSASNLKGFETQYYAIGGSRTRVHLKFVQATLTADGRAQDEARPLKNYFPLPAGSFYLRVIYLTRSTGAPHDMALVFARRAAALNDISARVVHDPQSCDAELGGCLWIPAAVAVRPEHLASASDPNSWQPVQ